MTTFLDPCDRGEAGALAHIPSAEICGSLRHCHSSWSFCLHRSQQKSIWAGISAIAVQSPGYSCKLTFLCSASSRAKLQTGVGNFHVEMRSVTPRKRMEQLNLQSLSECPQHPFPTFVPCDHLMSYYTFFF